MARGGSAQPIRAQCDMDSMFQLLQIDTAGCLEVVQERKGVPTLTHKVSLPPQSPDPAPQLAWGSQSPWQVTNVYWSVDLGGEVRAPGNSRQVPVSPYAWSPEGSGRDCASVQGVWGLWKHLKLLILLSSLGAHKCPGYHRYLICLSLLCPCC